MFSSSSSSTSSSAPPPAPPQRPAGPCIDVFVTSILSNPSIRGRHERTRRALTSARVPYREHDVAGDEEAKKLWKRKNGGKNELPFVLVDGEPVGSIEDMDEAVEFGELRQFLRLDTPRISPPSAPTSAESELRNSQSTSSPTAPPSGSSSSAGPAPSTSSLSGGNTHRLDAALSKTKPSIDDFADLDLTEEELASLARELTSASPEETYASLLSASQSRRHDQGDDRQSGGGAPSPWTSSSNHPPTGGYQFSHTQQFSPSYPSTAPLQLEKVNFVRPIRRRLASEIENDVLEGLDQGDLDEDALERLARELELEEEEHRRRRQKGRNGGADEAAAAAPPVMKTVESSIPPPLGDVTAVEGDGGASLSKPLKEVEALTIPAAIQRHEADDSVPHQEAGSNSQPSASLRVEPVSESETRARAEAQQAAAAASSSPPPPPPPPPPRDSPASEAAPSRTAAVSPRALEALKTTAPQRSGESEMPTFGIEATVPPP
ncbi:hypothetical protein JCM3774_003751 [Rhodotorula dairenensis]